MSGRRDDGTTPYRRAARGCRLREAPAAGGVRSAVQSAAALGSAALGGACGAVMMGSFELAMLAGAGALAAVAHVGRAAAARRRHAALACFLGSDAVREAPGTWTTPDGRRRVRSVSGDPHVRFEHLDPATDETLESFRGPSSVAPAPREPSPPLVRWVATVHGRPIDPRCFVGLPPGLGGRFARAHEAARVVVEVRAAGVLVERCNADGELIGDTWHRDVRSAKRQLENEYGAHLGRLRDPEREPDRPPAPAASWDAATTRDVAL